MTKPCSHLLGLTDPPLSMPSFSLLFLMPVSHARHAFSFDAASFSLLYVYTLMYPDFLFVLVTCRRNRFCVLLGNAFRPTPNPRSLTQCLALGYHSRCNCSSCFWVVSLFEVKS